MSSIMNRYMNSIERENDIFERAIQIESNKISLMVEAYYNKLENDYLLAEQKVMMENGTYEDLTYLYMEANEDANQNKETIFQKIRAFFERIFDRIKNFFKRDKDDLEGDAPRCFFDVANGGGGDVVINFFKGLLNDIKQGHVGNAIAKITQVTLNTFSIYKTISDGIDAKDKIMKYSKEKYAKVKKWFADLTTEMESVEKELTDAAERCKNNEATSFIDKVKGTLGEFIKWISTTWNRFKGFFKKNNNNDAEHQPPEKNNNNDAKQQLPGGQTRQQLPAGSSSKKPEDESKQQKKEENASEFKWHSSKMDVPVKAINAVKKECQTLISVLKPYRKKKKIDSKDSETIARINAVMARHNQGNMDNYEAFKMLYDSLDELLEIIKKVGTDVQIEHNENNIQTFKDKYVFNSSGVIIKESYFDIFDLYDEFTEIDDYDYDEIDYLFREYTYDPLIDDLINILSEF